MSQDTSNNKNPFDIDDAFFDSLEGQMDPKATTNKALLEDLDLSKEIEKIAEHKPVASDQANTQPNDEVVQAVAETNTEAQTDVSLDELLKPSDEAVAELPEPELSTLEAVPAAIPKSDKKSLFGGKSSAKQTKKSTAAKKANPITLILGGVLIILIVGLGWVFLGDDPNPQADVPQVTEQISALPTESTEPAVQEAAQEAQPTHNTGELIIATDIEPIDAEAIVQADIPSDPALIKEEIDRLADKDSQLAEQAKLIDEQLAMMQELTTAKEERIALLEAQIAQLEAQKSK